jgi:hypothetical protein
MGIQVCLLQPLGQICAVDQAGELQYASAHAKSGTSRVVLRQLFEDVGNGEQFLIVAILEFHKALQPTAKPSWRIFWVAAHEVHHLKPRFEGIKETRESRGREAARTDLPGA